MPKHEPTDCYIYLAKYLAKCMMRYDTLNCHDYGGFLKMTTPSWNVYSTDEGKSKRSYKNEKVIAEFFTNEGESKRIIMHECLSQS